MLRTLNVASSRRQSASRGSPSSGCVGAGGLGVAESGVLTDDVREAEHVAAPPLGFALLANKRRNGVGGASVGSDRPDQHDRISRSQQRTDGATGQLAAVEIGVDFVEPHHQPSLHAPSKGRKLGGVGRMNQPPTRQLGTDRLLAAAGLSHGGAADKQHEPALLGGGPQPGADTILAAVGVALYVGREIVGGCAW